MSDKKIKYPIEDFVHEDNKTNENHDVETEKLFQFIREDIIGKDKTFISPYGKRKVVYCDHIASSRALSSVESYIQEHVLTSYGNTHTSTTATSSQSSMFQHEARAIIRNAVRANEHDAVIFTGGGVTSAVHKLINGLDLSKKPPVVFVGPYEHHSNLLPWREIAVQVIPISEDATGQINLKHLEFALKEWKASGYPMLGSFSAASNVTGVITNTTAISALLHKYGALSFWDYATGAPYLDIDMHPLHVENADKDAVFISMHKFLGGVDAPGVLVVKRSLLQNKTPESAGGGTVLFVRHQSHHYLKDEEIREEGGTPRVVGIIRAGFAFQLKQTITVKTIMQREETFYKMVRNEWKKYPNIHLLGQNGADSEYSDRIAVFSFMIYHPRSKLYLHHNFVSFLLNDVFGIQARGGCACAGPYALNLLGFDDQKTDEIENLLVTNRFQYEVMRAGFVRLNIPYFASLDEVGFVIQAVAMISEMGWHCLPSYKFKPESGEWWHAKHKVSTNRVWLSNAKFTGHGLEVSNTVQTSPASESYEELLQMASVIFESSSEIKKSSTADHSAIFNDEVAHLRWFLLPSEALLYLTDAATDPSPHKCIIKVRREIKELSEAEIKEQIKITSNFNKAQQSSNKQKNIQKASNKISPGAQSFSKQKVLQEPASGTSFLRSKTKISLSLESNNAFCFVPPSKQLFEQTLKAIEDFSMIEQGDKVLVCLSGGKDSLSLLHILHQYQRYAKSKKLEFDLGAVTIDPKSSSYDPSPLIKYLEELQVTYYFERHDIINVAKQASPSSARTFISNMKRGCIYACARREGWNVLAFGHHLDDVAENFLMSAFHNGHLQTMKAKYNVKEGDLKVIRPLIYVRETETRQFAKASNLPIIPQNSLLGFSAPEEHHRMKQLLASQEIVHPCLFSSLKEAIRPLMDDADTEKKQKKENVFKKLFCFNLFKCFDRTSTLESSSSEVYVNKSYKSNDVTKL